MTQSFELTTRPADDIEIDPLQGRTQLLSIEVAVVVGGLAVTNGVIRVTLEPNVRIGSSTVRNY